MTNEVFERAIEIKDNINTIVELQSVLSNSKNNGHGDKYLAAIDVKKLNGFVVEDCNVLNHIRVPENIIEKFEAILWDELKNLQNEFESL